MSLFFLYFLVHNYIFIPLSIFYIANVHVCRTICLGVVYTARGFFLFQIPMVNSGTVVREVKGESMIDVIWMSLFCNSEWLRISSYTSIRCTNGFLMFSGPPIDLRSRALIDPSKIAISRSGKARLWHGVSWCSMIFHYFQDAPWCSMCHEVPQLFV